MVSLGADRVACGGGDARRAQACLLVLAMLGAPPGIAGAAAVEDDVRAARRELGDLLFRELRFTNPAADYGSSCAGCHATGEEVQKRTARAWADYVPRSMTAMKETTLRNTPTLLDVASGERFGWDGAASSLTELVLAKLTDNLMGWRPQDRERALDAIHFTLVNEGSGGAPGNYVDRFRQAWDADLPALSRDEVVRTAASALADFVTNIRSTRTSRWDAFAEQNRLKKAPSTGETPDSYAFGISSRLGNQEGRLLVRRPEGFSQEAYQGFKLFFRVYGEEGESVGNCVACHTPPYFTDFRLHNTGATQLEYDGVHGDGAFSRYAVPAEPSAATAAVPDPGHAERVDLGYWNHAPQAEREAALAAFKTPTLRNPGGTDPYLHNGAAATLEQAVAQKVRASQLARAGKLRNPDPELLEIRLTENDVAALVAFLKQLEDVGPENFRHYLIHFEEN